MAGDDLSDPLSTLSLQKCTTHCLWAEKEKNPTTFRYLNIYQISYDQHITQAAFTVVTCCIESVKAIYSLILHYSLSYFIHYLCAQRCMCTGTRHVCLCRWLVCSLQSGIRENVLQFPRIQMANCTRPPALNDKWQKGTFHPSPSLPLGCTLIFLLKVWWKAQLDVWMRAALERIWYRIMFNSYSA